MAASSFSVTNHISKSNISDFTFTFTNQRSKNLLLLKCKLSRKLQCRRRNLLVSKAVSGNQQLQKLVDQSIEQETTDTLDNGILVPDSESVISSIKYHAEFTPLFSPEKFELPKAFYATAESVRDTLITNWNTTYNYHEKMNVKQAYYLSMEFLQGRALLNAIGNLELSGAYAEALRKLGHDLEDVARQEQDAALGNGGLGRLASCFLDSLATLNYPAWGYGLRYKYGLFKQLITKDGQEEVAESWLEMGNPWEIPRKDVSCPIKFYGEVVTGPDGRKQWVGGENISAVAYDVPIPGYKTKTTINLRLWSTMVGPEYFNLKSFNSGDHAKAYEALKRAEKICYILYPGDESHEGKTLRLKQQYTLCSASLQDIISRFERRSGYAPNWNEFPEKVAVQMNDTHPTLCIPELLRILMDVKGLSWKEAWGITQRTVAYTNHTVLPEALEKWNLNLLQELLPRHIEIIKMIDSEMIDTIIDEYGIEDLELLKEKLNQMRVLENVELPASVLELLVQPDEIPTVDSVEEEEEEEKSEEVTEPTSEDDALKVKVEKAAVVIKKVSFDPDPKSAKMVRMANLCVVGGHAVNGVAEIHSEIVKNEVFNDFYKLWPEKFQNKTNGVTPRRWISFCNPELSKIITKWTGTDDWVLNTEKIDELRKFADNEELQSEWRKAKRINKEKMVSFLKEKTGYLVSPDAMFDVQVKRIHEYKRQLLNILGIVYRYKKMKEMNADERKAKFVPRVCIFGGKAFATYIQAKRIVKFITDVGATVNNDPDIGDLLKVIGNTGSNSTREAIHATEQGFAVGMHAALHINPYYGKTSQEGMVSHFKCVLPMGPTIIYNVPGRTGQDIPPSVIQSLAENTTNLAGVKECVGHERTEQHTKNDITVWSGNDDECHDARWDHGATGVISVASNLVPGLMRELMFEGKNSALNAKLLPLIKWLFCEPNPIGLNTALAQLGVVRPVFRLPYVPLSLAKRVEFVNIVKEIGREHFIGDKDVEVLDDDDFILVGRY